MAQNFVEVHIADSTLFTYKVKAGAVLKIGEIVELSGDLEVAKATAGSLKAIGVVYSGTPGIDGINVGYEGDKKHVVTVSLAAKANQLWLKAGTGGLAVGDLVKSDANGYGVKLTVGTDNPLSVIGIVQKAAVAGERAQIITK